MLGNHFFVGMPILICMLSLIYFHKWRLAVLSPLFRRVEDDDDASPTLLLRLLSDNL